MARRGAAWQGKARQGKGCYQRLTSHQGALSDDHTNGYILVMARRGKARLGKVGYGKGCYQRLTSHQGALSDGHTKGYILVMARCGLAGLGMAWPVPARLGRAGQGRARQGLLSAFNVSSRGVKRWSHKGLYFSCGLVWSGEAGHGLAGHGMAGQGR